LLRRAALEVDAVRVQRFDDTGVPAPPVLEVDPRICGRFSELDSNPETADQQWKFIYELVELLARPYSHTFAKRRQSPTIYPRSKNSDY
jgi:hypothetical protein